MSPKFHTNPVLNYANSHISSNMSTFLEVYFPYTAKSYLLLIQLIADLQEKLA